MDEEEEQRRSVRDFIVATDIYIYISLCLLDAYKKTRGVFFQRERRRTSITTTIFCALCPKETTRPLAVSISQSGTT